MKAWLPMTVTEMRDRGWDRPDVVCVSGDAYVDHPSFGTAIISRVLEDEGLKVVILAQPGFKNTGDFTKFGQPRFGFFVTGGNIDSMVAHYTAAKRLRSTDAYSPGGKMGLRPDRATIVYAKLIKEAYHDAPVVIGGVEASLRRFAHYDYWDDAVRPSILSDSGADLLVYGMGENQVREIARRLKAGGCVTEMTDIPGTCFLTERSFSKDGMVSCAGFEKVRDDKAAHAKACKLQIDEMDAVRGKVVAQRHGDRLLIQNPPMPPLTTEEMDAVYELPFTRMVHPGYEASGGVPAIQEVQFSIAHNRGCFGSCSFCALSFHQGRTITVRSRDSIVQEAEAMTHHPDFKGYIHDIGGPTANFRRPSCEKQLTSGVCKDRRCLAPTPCPGMKADHSEYLEILREVRSLPGIKQVFIRSGVRFDYLLLDKGSEFLDELVRHHVSGQLKVAPEHVSDPVLKAMGKPPVSVYEEFSRRFYDATKRAGKEQYLVPYLISSHPGSTLRDAVALALFLHKNRIRPEQVQDFYPTPGTVSTCMYHTGIDPRTGAEIYVPKSGEDKKMQRALLQYFMPKNHRMVRTALRKAGRADLIGPGKGCLVPEDPARYKTAGGSGSSGKAESKTGGRNAGTSGGRDGKAGGKTGGRNAGTSGGRDGKAGGKTGGQTANASGGRDGKAGGKTGGRTANASGGRDGKAGGKHSGRNAGTSAGVSGSKGKRRDSDGRTKKHEKR